MTTKTPEYYLKIINDIEESLKTIDDTKQKELKTERVKLQNHYTTLNTMRSELINIVKDENIIDNSPKTNIQLYDEYKELYVTYYFTNIALLLGILLLLRYIIYYISI
jgi:hypothetical protein